MGPVVQICALAQPAGFKLNAEGVKIFRNFIA